MSRGHDFLWTCAWRSRVSGKADTELEMKAVPPLAISPEKVCFIIIKAREFDAKDVVTDPDSGSNAADDHMISVLEDHGDDPVAQEITEFIAAMTEDEQVDLVALTWLGRGDGVLEDWADLRGEAQRVHNSRTAAYVLGMPLLSDYLEEGLSQFGLGCDDVEMQHL
jgi:hypothetical protein